MTAQSVGSRLGLCFASILGLVMVVTGCVSKGARQSASTSSGSRGIIVSPLAAQVSDPKRLLAVNAIGIEKPVFAGVVHSNVSEEG